MKQILIFTFLTLFSLPFLSCNSQKLPTKDIIITKENGKTVKVNAEIADNEESRNYGFMNRKHIPEGTGMLFIFEYDQVLSFWMKNTPHPLSIAYIDARGQIRDIYNMTPFSLSPIFSSGSVRYALEVPQGWFDKVGVKVGDTISLK